MFWFFLLSLVINGYVTFMVMLIPVLDWELLVFCLLMWSSYGFLHYLSLLHWKFEAECGLLYTCVSCVWTVVSTLLTALHGLFYKASQSNDQSIFLRSCGFFHLALGNFNCTCYACLGFLIAWELTA
jgi:hypothetical protein